MESNAGPQRWYGGDPCTLDGRRPKGPLRPVNHPPPTRLFGGARGLGNLVRPESHPEPRGFPVQWADPGIQAGAPT